NQHCDIQNACVAPYLAAFPNGRGRDELERNAQEAAAACQAARARDDEAASKARQCVTAKRAANEHCDIQDACVASYLAAFPAGRGRDELEHNAQDAAAACQATRALDDEAASKARQCVTAKRAANEHCDIRNACVAPYLAVFPNG